MQGIVVSMSCFFVYRTVGENGKKVRVARHG